MGRVTINSETRVQHYLDSDELHKLLEEAALLYLTRGAIPPPPPGSVTVDLDTSGQLPDLTITVVTRSHEEK